MKDSANVLYKGRYNDLSFIVDEIRKNKETGMSLEDAVAKAVKDCADKNILAGFLRRYGGEVVNMLYAEWNLDEYVAVQKREAAEDAAEQVRAEERKIAVQLERKAKLNAAKKAIEMGLAPEQAAKLADLPVDEIIALV